MELYRSYFRQLLRYLGQSALSIQCERQKPAWHTDGACCSAAGQRIGAAPAGHHRNVLHTVNLISHRRSDHAGPDGNLPEFFALVGAVRNKAAVGSSLEYKIARRAEGAAVPHTLIWNSPSLFLINRIPGQQERTRLRRLWIFEQSKVDARVTGARPELKALFGRVNEYCVLSRNIDQARLRVIGHWLPVVGPKWTGLHECHALFISGRRILGRPPGLLVNPLCPTDRHYGLGRDQFTRSAVQHIKEPVLGRLHQNLAVSALYFELRKNHVLSGGEIP